MVHNDQGLTQLRRFCETVGAASQISYMLTEDFHFYFCKLTLGSIAGIYQKKYYKALQLQLQISLSSGVIFETELQKGNMVSK